MLVGTKGNALHRRKVSIAALQRYIEKWKLPFVETDVQSNVRVFTPFLLAARYFMKRQIAKQWHKEKKMTVENIRKNMPDVSIRLHW